MKRSAIEAAFGLKRKDGLSPALKKLEKQAKKTLGLKQKKGLTPVLKKLGRQAQQTAELKLANVRERIEDAGTARLQEEIAEVKKELDSLKDRVYLREMRTKTVSLTEAEQLFKVQRATLLKALNRKRLQGVRDGAKWRVEVEEIVRWMQEGNHKPGRPRKAGGPQ